MARLKIFVGGVHGTGKSSFCRQLKEHLMCEYVSASTLLNWKSKSKQVNDVPHNQAILAELLQSHTQDDVSYIIDGHFALWNKNNECELVPLETFSSINLDAIIIITCAPELIHKRLEDRDSLVYKLENITNLQTSEIKQAKYIAESLDIPLMIVNMDKNFDLYTFVKKNRINETLYKRKYIIINA